MQAPPALPAPTAANASTAARLQAIGQFQDAMRAPAADPFDIAPSAMPAPFVPAPAAGPFTSAAAPFVAAPTIPVGALTCGVCQKGFSSVDHLRRHLLTVHRMRPVATLARASATPGQPPAKKFKATPTTAVAVSTTTPAATTPASTIATSTTGRPKTRLRKHREAATALNGAVVIHTISGGVDATDLSAFLVTRRSELTDVLRREMDVKRSVKWYAVAEARFNRSVNASEHVYMTSYFRSQCAVALTVEDLPAQIEFAIIKILAAFESFKGHGSGWVLEHVVGLDVNSATFEPLAAASYVPTPPELLSKQAIVNVQNGDQKCFVWAVLAALHPAADHPNRVTKYQQHEASLHLDGLTFPVPLAQIPRFEAANDVSVNVFGYEKEVFPLRIAAERRGRHVNLLLLGDGTKSHYVTIRSMSRLLNYLTKHREAVFYCDFCLHRFSRGDLLRDHSGFCMAHGPQRITMPKEENKWLKFSNLHMQLRVPYCIYGDLESVLVKVDSCSGDPAESSTEVVTRHEACGYAYVIVGPDGKAIKPASVYRGEDAVDHFIAALQTEEKAILNILEREARMKITPAQEREFRTATTCHICSKPLGKDRVRDHDHLGDGLYRGAAHNACNPGLKLTKKIPVFFHHLRGYDSHHLLQGIGKVKDRRIGCIAANMQKYITFSLGNLQFLDSMQFLATSLERLVDNLPGDGFGILRQRFSDEEAALLRRKGVYPYSYMDGFERFDEDQLPPIEAFHNDLSGEPLLASDYEHAQKVWETFGLRSLGEYHDLYVETDVLLLASVFENFRALTMSYYGLDAARNLTAPSLAWNAALKMTGVRLELLTDIDMHLFVERGIRGGVCAISKRHARANNTYLAGMDASLPTSYIVYLDANNLYGHAMVQPLPHRDFRWLSAEELQAFDPTAVVDDAEVGYFVEVDLAYPMELHDLHNDYPLAPESLKIIPEMLSPYTCDLSEDLGQKPKPVTKLTSNLMNKERYVVHYRNLKLYLELGMVLKKVHRAIAFHQSPWLKSYIDFNTERRKEAKTPVEKDFFKLMNNSVFGKTMENLRNHVDVHLVNTEKRLKKLVASPAFRSFSIFSKDLVGVDMQKKNLLLNRPIYAGMAILDVSKIVMYRFNYDFIKEKYGEKASLLFTDTDSLCYEIETEDVYRDFGEHQDLFDFSDYPVTHPLHSNVNKKRLGKMKDELNGVLVEEFVGLRPKMYSLKSRLDTRKTAKGVGKAVIRNVLRHEDYRSCLLDRQLQRVAVPKIASVNHRLHTVISRRIGLSPYDDKRFILPSGVETLAHGHWATLPGDFDFDN